LGFDIKWIDISLQNVKFIINFCVLILTLLILQESQINLIIEILDSCLNLVSLFLLRTIENG
jgi:hypothetical protein